MHIWWGAYVHVPNMKFLCLTLWQGYTVCTDADTDTNDDT